MNPRQKILAGLAVAAALALAARQTGPFAPGPLPEVRKEALDAETIREIEAIERATRADHAEDWLRLGRIYRAFNLLAAADYCFARADQLAPQRSEHLHDWVATLSRMGKTREAAAIGARALAAEVPEASEVRLILARDLLREGNIPGAEARLRELADNPDAMLLLARLLMRTGRAQEAGPLLDRWLEAAPDDFRARQLRAWVAEALGNEEEARRHRELALRSRAWIHRGDPSGHRDQQVRQQFAHGKILARAQQLESESKWSEAADALRQAVALAWSDEDAARIASLELNAGRPQRAAEQLERLIQTSGNSGEHLLALAQACLAAGDASRAYGHALKAEEMGANQSPLGNLRIQQFLLNLATQRNDTDAMRRHQARAQFELAKQSWMENNIAQAHQQLVRAAVLSTDHPQIWYYLGETHALLGNAVAARQSYRRCLQLQPNHGRALTALERLK